MPRFVLSFDPELPDPAFAQIVVQTADAQARDALRIKVRKLVDDGLLPRGAGARAADRVRPADPLPRRLPGGRTRPRRHPRHRRRGPRRHDGQPQHAPRPPRLGRQDPEPAPRPRPGAPAPDRPDAEGGRPATAELPQRDARDPGPREPALGRRAPAQPRPGAALARRHRRPDADHAGRAPGAGLAGRAPGEPQRGRGAQALQPRDLHPRAGRRARRQAAAGHPRADLPRCSTRSRRSCRRATASTRPARWRRARRR